MNCIIIDDHDLSEKAIEHFIKKVDFLNLTCSFSNPIDALSFLDKNKVDLIFLDIEMPEMNGIEFINAITSQCPQIILTTYHKEFAIEAFDCNVTDYLMKPLVYARFFKAVSKAKNIFEKENANFSDDTVFLKKNGAIVRLKKSDILWIEALVDYVIIHTHNEKYIFHSTMKAMEDKLLSKEFMRVHRSYIVRIDKIDSIQDHAIAFDKKLIPIGLSYRENVLKRLNMF
jgi:DNA-binding LytR/AlgR family response regulator